MKIILTQDIQKLGQAGEVVNVANGYARNYLLPRKMAIVAFPANLARIDGIKKKAEEHRQAEVARLNELAAKVNGTKVEFERKFDDKGTMFGSVSEIDIANVLHEKGFDIHKAQVNLEKHLKEVGEFNVDLILGHGVKAAVKVVVKSDQPLPAAPVVEAEEVEEEQPEQAPVTDVEKEIQNIENSEAIDQ